jgi:GNAT superfamily N-acetyltransferase
VTNGAAPAYRLRDMSLDDIPDGLRLCRAAGWNQRDDDWRLLLTLNPGRFVAAVSGDRIMGTGGAVCYGRDLAWVCMILVDPDERGHGLGTRITEEVLHRLCDVGRIGLDATPRGEPIYARLGFVETERLVRMEATGAARGGDDGKATRLAAGDLDAVLAMDREVFGADRRDVLGWAFRQAPAWCVKDGGRITGYCFGRAGERYRQIGPVVAPNVDQARGLVEAALHSSGGPVVVDASAGHTEWIAALGALGFHEERPLVRMYHRGGGTVRPSELQLAIFGPEFG